MIARAPHEITPGVILPTYPVYRLKVLELISEITRGLECWSYVKTDQRTQNGRLAFQNLYKHYLGTSNVDDMENLA